MKRDKTWQIKRISDLEVVRAVDQYRSRRHRPYPYEDLAEMHGCPEKVAYRACERAFGNGLIDYGVSLRTGWLTDKGKALLEGGGS